MAGAKMKKRQSKRSLLGFLAPSTKRKGSGKRGPSGCELSAATSVDSFPLGEDLPRSIQFVASPDGGSSDRSLGSDEPESRLRNERKRSSIPDDDNDDDVDDVVNEEDVDKGFYECTMALTRAVEREDRRKSKGKPAKKVDVDAHTRIILKCIDQDFERLTASAKPSQEQAEEQKQDDHQDDKDDDSEADDDDSWVDSDDEDSEAEDTPKVVEKERIDISPYFNAGEYLIQQFLMLHPDLSKKFADAHQHKAWVDIWEGMDKYFYEKLSGMYLDPEAVGNQGDKKIRDSLSTNEAAMILTWIETISGELEEQDIPACAVAGLEMCEEWEEDRETLLGLYIEKSTLTMMRPMLEKTFTVRFDAEPRLSDDELLVTDFAENVMFIITQQAEAAKGGLPAHCHSRVLAACNKEMCTFFAEVLANVDKHCKNIRTKGYCTFINDSFKLSELLDDFNEEFKADAISTSGEGEEDYADETSINLAQLGMAVTKRLVERIVNDMCKEDDPVLSTVGGLMWEQPECQPPLERVVGTLDDYLGDLREWLPNDYVFPKLLKSAFDYTLQVYFKFFFKNTLTREISDPAQIGKLVMEDRVTLSDFFSHEDWEEYQGHAGYYAHEVIDSRLHAIDSIARLVDPEIDLEDCGNDISCVLTEFCSEDDDKSKTALAVLHLAGIRKTMQGPETIKLLVAVADAKVQMKGRKEKEALYKLPSLASSKQVRAVILDGGLVQRLSQEQLDLTETIRAIIVTNQQMHFFYDASEAVMSVYDSGVALLDVSGMVGAVDGAVGVSDMVGAVDEVVGVSGMVGAVDGLVGSVNEAMYETTSSFFGMIAVF